MSGLSSFFEAWELFRLPALAGAIAGALLGWLGVFVVLRRMIFLAAALSQAASLGVAAAFFAGIHLGATSLLASPTAGAVLATVLATLLLLPGERTGARDARLGVAFLVGSAGTLALGSRIVQEVQDIQAILFGSAVAVAEDDFAVLAGLAALVLALHLWWRRGFLVASFDRDGAAVRGVPVLMLEIALLGTMAISISVATRILGALPVFAFSVLPALAAIRLAANVPRALGLATAIGAASGFAGYVAAFLWALPVGAAQTLAAAGAVALAHALAWLNGARARRRPATSSSPEAAPPLPGPRG